MSVAKSYDKLQTLRAIGGRIELENIDRFFETTCIWQPLQQKETKKRRPCWRIINSSGNWVVFLLPDSPHQRCHWSRDWNMCQISFSNSLIIHDEKTKEITTVKEVWIRDPNYYKIRGTFTWISPRIINASKLVKKNSAVPRFFNPLFSVSAGNDGLIKN